jgi:hypothetical protein
MNYEEGSEPSVQDGEGHTDIGLTDAHGMGQAIHGRDLAGESDRLDRDDDRPSSRGLVLPLWPRREHAPPGRRGRRVPLRL